MKNQERIYKLSFSGVYPYYVEKAEKKGRTRAKVDEIICWLTGYREKYLQDILAGDMNFETFFTQASQINPNASKITGAICSYRVEEIENDIVQKARYLDKLIDELGKGKAMEKILRK
jgi:hypothetical protein